jgi:hypothetical protein
VPFSRASTWEPCGEFTGEAFGVGPGLIAAPPLPVQLLWRFGPTGERRRKASYHRGEIADSLSHGSP